MSEFTRRQLLRSLASCLAGTVVLARTVLAAGTKAPSPTPASPSERADRLAEVLPAPENAELASFVNRAFANARGGVGGAAFRNGGFANGGGVRTGGAFRNG